MGIHFADGPTFGTDLENSGVVVCFTNGSYNPSGEDHDPAHDDDLVIGANE